MLRSMTGHGVAQAPLGRGSVTVEVRALNHRYLDVRVRVGPPLIDYAAVIEELVRTELTRGRVDVVARLHGEALPPPRLDFGRARQAYEDLCRLRDELRPEESVPLALLAGVPELFTASRELDADAIRTALDSACRAACQAADAMRVREGAALSADLRTHLDELAASSTAAAARVPNAVAAHRDKLRTRIERLLAEVRTPVDPGRLEHEVALFADRSDVAEELSRLQSHIEQIREVLARGDGGGRRLDFLLQETSREVNTLGSKIGDAEIARIVVDMKTAVSRMREQAQNVL